MGVDGRQQNLRQALKCVLDRFGDGVEDIIFTTYAFDPVFFEEHILAYLMGVDGKICTIDGLNDANDWVKRHRISIYYDQGALEEKDSPITLDTYPMRLDKGVFHPKVIVVYGREDGREAAYLFVSSSNLTVSGYGRNIEAFAAVEVTTETVAKSLAAFIAALAGMSGAEDGYDKGHEALTGYLNGVKGEGDIEFFWNLGRKGERPLADKIAGIDGDIIVVSPYYDKAGPERMLNRCAANSGKRTVVPAVDGQTYNILRSSYEALKDSVAFLELRNDSKNLRFAHAKIIAKGKSTIVGSYNFTTAALEGQNAEAALIFNGVGGIDIAGYCMDIDARSFAVDIKDIVNKDEPAVREDVPCFRVTVDWAARKIYVSDAVDGYELYFEDKKCKVDWEGKDAELTIEIERVILKHKRFRLYRNGRLVLIGLIREENWEEARPRIACDSLKDALSGWYKSIDGQRKKVGLTRDARPIFPDEGAEFAAVTSDIGEDVFDNYYLAAVALNNLLERVSAVGFPSTPQRRTDVFMRKRAELYSIFKTSAISMVRIAEFLKNEKEDDMASVVRQWVICLYLEMAAGKLPERLCPKNSRSGDFTGYERELKGFKKYIAGRICEYEEKLKADKDVNEEYIKWIKEELFVDDEERKCLTA